MAIQNYSLGNYYIHQSSNFNLLIREFLTSQFPNVKKVLIDPETANKRAIHVYQKAGFKIIGEFIASWHPVPHYQMELYIEDLLNPKEFICN